MSSPGTGVQQRASLTPDVGDSEKPRPPAVAGGLASARARQFGGGPGGLGEILDGGPQNRRAGRPASARPTGPRPGSPRPRRRGAVMSARCSSLAIVSSASPPSIRCSGRAALRHRPGERGLAGLHRVFRARSRANHCRILVRGPRRLDEGHPVARWPGVGGLGGEDLDRVAVCRACFSSATSLPLTRAPIHRWPDVGVHGVGEVDRG